MLYKNENEVEFDDVQGQSGNPPFDWQSTAQTLQLNLPDLAKIKQRAIALFQAIYTEDRKK